MRYQFDRELALRTGDFLSRKLLFLDLNFWIDFGDRKTAELRHLADILLHLVQAGKLLCPVSISLLLETLKLQPPSRRSTLYALMDRLSLRLTLRLHTAVFRDEFRRVMQGEETDRSVAYTHVIDALLDSPHIAVPDGWAKPQAEDFLKQFGVRLSTLTIAECMEMVDEAKSQDILSQLRSNLMELARESSKWDADNKVSRDRLEKWEFAATIRSFIPEVARVLLTLQDDTLLPVKEASDQEKRDLLNSCPTFWSEHKVLAALRATHKPLTENDFWDVQHIASAVPYVDCLACDRFTRNVVAEVARADRQFGTTIARNSSEVTAWLESMELLS